MTLSTSIHLDGLRLRDDEPALVRGLVAAGAFASFSDKPELTAFIRRDIAPLTDPVPRALAHAFQMDTLATAVAPGLVEAMVDESLRVPAHVWREAFDALLRDDGRPTPSICRAPSAGRGIRALPAPDTRCTGSSPSASRASWCASSSRSAPSADDQNSMSSSSISSGSAFAAATHSFISGIAMMILQ
jgi:hypothetical protein